jgi:3'(2'), 5'-bisphosphate nucleotidase
MLSAEFELAKRLAREAGALILRYYGRPLQVDYKPGDSPVTDADRAANDHIVAGLGAAFPEDGILAEESTDSARRLGCARLWCIDPLDGTKDFLQRNGYFAVMIGLAIDGRARLGVVYQPTEDRLFWGDGQSACEEYRGQVIPLACKGPSGPLRQVVSRSHPSARVVGWSQALGVAVQIPMGSVGLKMAYVAQGGAHFYLSATSRTKEWDACGPEAILASAGGQVTDMDGAALRYNKEEPNTPAGIVASDGLVHAQVLGVLRGR